MPTVSITNMGGDMAPKIDELIENIPKDQIEILRKIWKYFLQTKEWPKGKPFRKEQGRLTVERVVTNLKSIFIWHMDKDNPSGEYYRLTTEGVFAVEGFEGPNIKLLLSYLDYLRKKFDENPAFEKVTAQEVRENLHLSSEDIRILGELLGMGNTNLWGVHAGNLGTSDWTAGVLDDIEILYETNSSQEFLFKQWDDHIKWIITSSPSKAPGILGLKKSQIRRPGMIKPSIEIPQTGTDKLIVFLSHVEEDAALASEIKMWLEDNLPEGAEIFVSSDKGILPGDKWEELIIEKLTNCGIALVLCTEMSVRQPWINFEAGGAWVQGARIIPLCYHGMRKDMLPRPLSSRQAIDLSESDDVCELLKIIATEAGLHVPDVNPKDFIEKLPQRNNEELDANGKLPDVRVEVNLTMAGGDQGNISYFLAIEAKNHDENSVFLTFPSIAIKNSRKRLWIVNDFAHNPVPTGELRPGDSRTILVNPAEFKLEGDLGDLEQLGEVIFSDKIGRKFEGSAEDTLNAIKAWKSAER